MCQYFYYNGIYVLFFSFCYEVDIFGYQKNQKNWAVNDLNFLLEPSKVTHVRLPQNEHFFNDTLFAIQAIYFS